MKQYIIDRVLNVYVSDPRTGKLRFVLSHLSDVQMRASVNTVDVVDAQDATITTLNRAKSFELSATHAFMNLDLLAEQLGYEETASAADNFPVPCIDELPFGVGETEVQLTHAPISGPDGEPTLLYIYTTADGHIDEVYDYALEATESTFTYSGQTLTLPLGLSGTAGGSVLVSYDYLANDERPATRVIHDADGFSATARVLLEAVFRDACNPAVKLFGWVELLRARVSSDVDLDLASDGGHPLNIKALRSYCANRQQLCTVYLEDEREGSEFDHNYNNYFNKPSINHVVLRGDKSFDDLYIIVPEPMPNEDIDVALGWG